MSVIYGAADEEVPQYFLCPISLQIMKDPVTTATGITYDRPSIDAWLSARRRRRQPRLCPVTNQPIPEDSEGAGLTPNHTLRRLIQSWCTLQRRGDGVTTPQSTGADPAEVVRLLDELRIKGSRFRSADAALVTIERIARESESNRGCIVQAGAEAKLGSFISICSRSNRWDLIERALKVFSFLLSRPRDQEEAADSTRDVQQFGTASDVDDLIQALTRFLLLRPSNEASSRWEAQTHAILLLKTILRSASANPHTRTLERLEPEFFSAIIDTLHDAVSTTTNPTLAAITQRCIKSSLHVLHIACPWGGNRAKASEAGAVAELVELLLSSTGGRRVMELALGVLDLLCACAEGRARLLAHSAGIAVVAKKLLRVSAAGDERAVAVLAAIARCCGGKGGVLREMLTVGAVSKLCMVIQADCSKNVKEMARGVLRMHSDVWANSPCIALYLLTRYPQH